MNNHSHSLIASAALALSAVSTASAGEPPASPQTSNSGSMFSDFDFCNWLSNKPGTIYKNKENPWINEISFSGRFHYNAAYVEGSGTDGREWSESYSDIRRFRLAAKIGFLKYLSAKAIVNLVDDQRPNGSAAPALRELHLGYYDFDEAAIALDLKGLMDLEDVDKLELIYGRFKWHGGFEARTSSNDLLTVERSALANKLHDGARPTGIGIHAVKKEWELLTGVYTTDGRDPETGLGESRVNLNNNEFLGAWNDALMYNVELLYTPKKGLRFGYEFLYNGGNQAENGLAGQDDNQLPYKWAHTLSMEYQFSENAGIDAEVVYGDNGNIDQRRRFGRTERQGMFGGFILMPYYWVVPKKLQAVVQYMYEASEEDQGVRSNSRYMRGADSGATNSGRGDQLQSLYAGLNWHLCHNNIKLQFGVQEEMLRTPFVGDGSVAATTALFGFRSNF